MRDISSRTTIDIEQIAEIANVGRSAVGNWRKRHVDFPVQDPSGRFDLIEVEKWLIENGKIDSRIPPEVAFWSLVDSLPRLGLRADATIRLLVSLLVFLEACEQSLDSSHQRVSDVTVREQDQWGHLKRVPLKKLYQELFRAAKHIEEANPKLDGLLVDGLVEAAALPGKLFVELVENLEASTNEANPRLALFNIAISWARKLDRFRGMWSTPPHIAELMINLAGNNGETVCDLACGEGGLLSSAALSLQSHGAPSVKLFGYDIAESALRIARSRFFLQSAVASFHLTDSLRVPHEKLPQADIVLCDTPLGMNNWGDAAIYLDERWRFGVPPRNKADLAWMQLAIQCLSDSGRAVVSTSPSSVFSSSGREQAIRKAMLEQGAIKAVIQLPGRMRAETSIPIFLWVLQPPRPDADSVLLVDASNMGTTSRSQHSFNLEDISRIACTLQTFELGKVEDTEIAQIVSIADILQRDAVLEPKVYRPISGVDTNEVRCRSEEIRSHMSVASEGIAEAVGQVLVSRDSAGDGPPKITCALEEVTEIYLGARGAERELMDQGTLLIGIREVSGDGACPPRYVAKESALRQVVEIQENDVVIALRGSTGRSILATSEHAGAVLDHGCALIRPTSSQVTVSWIYLWMQSTQFQDQVTRSTTGVTMPILSMRALRELRVPIPMVEQLGEAEQLVGVFGDALDRVTALQSDLTELRQLEVELLVAHDCGSA